MRLLGVAAVLVAGVGFAAVPTEAEAAALNAKYVEEWKRAQAVKADAANALKVENWKLWDDYDANEVAADEKYKGKRLEVTGIVARVEKDFTGSVIIQLVARNQFMATRAGMVATPDDRIAKLKKGDKVIALCTGAGRIMGIPMLTNCTLLKAFSRESR